MSRSDDRRPKRWAKPALIGCLIIPFLICAFGGFILLSQINGHANKLPGEIAKLKALGVPTEAADLAPNPAVPDSENAATLYGSICYQLDAISKDKSQEELVKLLDTYNNSKDPRQDLPKALSAIQEKQSLFSDADKLLTKPLLDFKRDYAQGFQAPFSEYEQFKRLAKWQCSRARAQWLTGNREASLKSLEGAFLVSSHAAQEPVLIAQLVAIATHAVAHRTLTAIMADAQNDPAILKRLEGIVEKAKVADMRSAYGGEVVLGRYALQKLRSTSQLVLPGSESRPQSSEGLVDSLLGNQAIRAMFEAKWCEAWRTCFEKFPKDKDDWMGVHAVLQDFDSKLDADTSMANSLNLILFPVLVQAHTPAGKNLAEHRLELLSLRLLQMRSKGLPPDLKAFGKIGIDPFTGKPMGYEHKGKSFRVWSAGPPGKSEEISMSFN